MTSRDLTENVEQLQVQASAGARARPDGRRPGPAGATWPAEYDELVIAGRVPQRRRAGHDAGQAVRLRRRRAAGRVRAARATCSTATRCAASRARSAPRRTSSTCSTATPPSSPSSSSRVAAHLGFDRVLTSVGQVYPRSLDFDVVSALVQLAAGPSSLATTIRLMAGHELVTEGFQAGQVGSSAMPHKMNTRSCERVNGLAVVLRGYLSMVGELAGDQWNEGDVSCSVVRRVALPDAFFAARRAVRDVPHRARRVRCVPGGHRARAATATCRSSPRPRC